MKRETALWNSGVVLILLLATAMLVPAAGAAAVSTAVDILAAENLTPPHPPGWEPSESPMARDGGALYPATAFDSTSNSLILYEGWNHVSTPLWLADGSNTFSIFAGVDTADHSILLYTGSNQWEAMTAEDEFKPLDGIWIFANESYRIPLHFKPPQEQRAPVKHLCSEWNAVGFWDVHQACARDMLLPLGNTWSKAQGYDAGT